jgi:hypothetical protein
MKVLVWITGLLLAVAAGLEIYCRLPSNASIAPLELPADTRYAVLLFHGSNGKDEPLLREIAAAIDARIGAQPGVVVRHVVWSPWSDNRLRAQSGAAPIARQLGTELAELENLEYARFIVHSAGGYLLTPLCETYKSAAVNPAHIEMTYLDSMGIHGAWDYFYGYRHYGECADYSATVFTSDGNVPGTNAPLEQSFSIDVTASPQRANTEADSHHWPVDYFLQNLSEEEITPGLRTHEAYPRGVVVER